MTDLVGKLRMGRSVALLLSACMIVLAIAIFAIADRQIRSTLYEAAAEKQTSSIKVLASVMQLSGIEADARFDAKERLERLTVKAMPTLDTHAIVDRVSQITGEPATIFLYDAAKDDFIRVTTSVKKQDGSRAVGTVLGKDSAASAPIRRGEVYLGEAKILGKSYFTEYAPMFGPDGKVAGILFTGVGKDRVDAEAMALSLSIAGVSLVLLLAGVFGALFAGDKLTAPIRHLADITSRIARDETVDAIPYGHWTNEIGVMSGAVTRLSQRMVERKALQASLETDRVELQNAVAEAIGVLEAARDHDLTGRVALSGKSAEMAKLCRSVNDLLETLSETVGTVKDNSSSISSGTRQIAQAAEDLAHRNESSAASLEQTTAALTEITSTVRESAQDASHARTLVDRAKGDAQRGGEVVRRATKAMLDIEEASRQINQIIVVIDEIAFQTNLLALNAGVEAARAGESGRGFAVVASEVRALAHRSADAAKQIKTLITGTTGQVQRGVELVGETGKALESIVGAVLEVNAAISQLAQRAEDQAAAISEVSIAVNELDSVTQRNAAMVEETTAATRAVADSAAELLELVSTFETDSRAAPQSYVRRAA